MQQYLIMSPNMWREKNQNLGMLPARDLPRLARVQLALLRPPRRPPLAPRLRQREHAGPEGGIRGRLPRVVGVDALLLQALPRVALELPSRGVVARRPLVRPLLARPEQPHAAGPLLAQPQRGKRPAARCRRQGGSVSSRWGEMRPSTRTHHGHTHASRVRVIRP